VGLNDLAAVLRTEGDYAGAWALYARALAIAEKMLGPEHPQTAAILNNLAEVLQAQGDYAGAKPLNERVLTICEKTLGVTVPDTSPPTATPQSAFTVAPEP
jgi:tetratricopeptide (TPR) repeat protein